jgi:hypothetical protein
MKKKRWESPKLVVLYRGKAEESVLGYCKLAGQDGPESGFVGCMGIPADCNVICQLHTNT